MPTITLYDAVNRTTPRETLDLSFDHLAFFLDAAWEFGPDKKSFGGWGSHALYAGTGRADENVEQITFLVFDIEGKPDPLDDETVRAFFKKLKQRGIAFYWHTTYSHKPTENRLRLVVDLLEPIPAAQFREVWAVLVDDLAIADLIDRSACNASRFWWLPSAPSKEIEHESEKHDGAPLDWRLAVQRHRAAAGPSSHTQQETTQRKVLILQDRSADEKRERLLKLANAENRELVRRVLDGEMPTARGERDVTINRVASAIAFALPEIAPEEIVELMMPSLSKLEPDDQDPEPDHWVRKALDCAERARKRKLEADELQQRTAEALRMRLNQNQDGASQVRLAPEQLLEASGLGLLGENPDPELLDSTIRQLAAALSNQDRLTKEITRSIAAKRLEALGVQAPARILDAALASVMSVGDPQRPGLIFPDVEADKEPQDTGALLADLCHVFESHVVLQQGGAVVLALWTLHTWTIEAAEFTPRIGLTSPAKRCGKTTVLELLAELCWRPLLSANLSTAVLFRSVEKFQPTLLIDETDTFIWESEELRGVINAGYSRSGRVLRCVGDDHEPAAFSCFTPIAIAAIGGLPGTIADRSIILRMERKPKGTKMARHDSKAREVNRRLCSRLRRWADDNVTALKHVSLALPESLNDRHRDICEPLLVIAHLAGGPWPERAQRAIVAVCAAAEVDEADVRERALAAVWAAFQERGADFLSLKQIVDALLNDDSAGWDTAVKGRPLTPGTLAKWLKPFGLRTKQRRQPPDGKKHPRGFEREQLAPVVERYLPISSGPLLEREPGRDSGTPNLTPRNLGHMAGANQAGSDLQAFDSIGCRAVAPSRPIPDESSAPSESNGVAKTKDQASPFEVPQTVDGKAQNLRSANQQIAAILKLGPDGKPIQDKERPLGQEQSR